MSRPFDAFPGGEKPNKRRVFDYWEVGALMDGLAHCSAPAMTGLNEGPFAQEMHDDRDRHARYKLELALKLTRDSAKPFWPGPKISSRHNPIHRWWGATELTNDRLWRWDPANRALIVAP